jgi:membrane-associated phospholipid phosphatase
MLLLLPAAILLASWHLPMTRDWWQYIDVWGFRAINHTLTWGAWWYTPWGIANMRVFDLVPASAFAALFLVYVAQGSAGERWARFVSFSYVVAFCVAMLALSSAVLEIERQSPTKALDNVIRLSELMPGVKLKDASGNSIPGDHATTLALLAVFLWRLAGARLGAIGVVVAVIFALPRLVSGAHWLSDILVGSTICVALALALAFATPLTSSCVRLIIWATEPLRHWLSKRLIPGLARSDQALSDGEQP